jgi:hypothetical protein
MAGPGTYRKRSGCLKWLIRLGVIGAFLFAFRYEFSLIADLVQAGVKLGLQAATQFAPTPQSTPLAEGEQPAESGVPAEEVSPTQHLPPAEDLLRQSLFITFNLVGCFGLAYFLVYIISGAVIPLEPGTERWEMFRRFYRYLRGWRFPVLQIREAKLAPDLHAERPASGGVALVDLSSAIVLEQQRLSRSAKFPFTRVRGAGVVFIDPSEKLRSLVSLRKQRRCNKQILAYTSDGIEVKTDLTVTFTIGQPASVIKVAYQGDPYYYNLRVLKVDPLTSKITAIVDELEEVDKRTIHEYAQRFLTFLDHSARLEPEEPASELPPFQVDEERIKSAVYYFARNTNDGNIEQWSDLPMQVAVETFRHIIAQRRFDDLYLADQVDIFAFRDEPPGKFPLLTEVKPEFFRRLRYRGVVSFQFVHHLKGRSPVEGLRLDNRAFRVSPVQALPPAPGASMVLRERGIKIVGADFSEVVPTDEKITLRRMENWRARWQQQIELYKSELEQQAARIRDEARSIKLNEMIRKLLAYLQQEGYAADPLLQQIVQTLEEILDASTTRKLTPEDTIRLVNTLQTRVVSDGKTKKS